MRSEPLRQAGGGDAEELLALRSRVADLQSKVEELSGRLQLKELEAENQQERSDCLEIMLKKLGEKDDTTELLLEQLTEENQELTRKLLASQDVVLDKEHLIRNLEERCEELEEQLSENRRLIHDSSTAKASSEAHDALAQENDSLRDELYHSREIAQNFERDLITRTTAFEQRLAALERERDDLRNSLTVERSKASFHSDDVESKQHEVYALENRLNTIVEMVKSIYPSFLRNMQDVEFQIDSRLENMDARLSESADMLYAISTTMPLRKEEQDEDSLTTLPISRSMLERTLRETQLALQDACNRHQDDEEHIQRLSDDLHRMQDERHFHLGTIQELERQVAALRNVTHVVPNHSQASKPPLPPSHASTTAVEVSDLKARLCAVESRAEKAAAEHAKLYAQHVRMIAYLESECSRLRGLGDHFRAMNVKLMADLKKAKLQGLKCRGLENRITILAENEKKAMAKLQHAERSLMERNEEILSLIREKESEDRHKALRYDEEINSVHEQVETLHRQLQDSSRNYETLLSKYHAMEHDYKSELHHFQLQLDHSEHESMLHNRRAEELALELQTALEQLKEREHTLAQCEMKLDLAMQKSEVSSSNYERTLRELSTELEERVAKLETMEETVQTLKQKIILLEDDLLRRNKESATKLIERTQFENELQQLRDALQEQLTMVSSLQQANTLLTNQGQTWKRQLEASEERYQHLTDNHMKALSERAMRAEAALHQTREELKEKKEELLKQDELLLATRASLQEVEATLQHVQSDYISLETNEQLLRASNETLVEENEMFRGQIQEVLQQHSTLMQKHLTKNSEYNVLLDRVEELESRNLTMIRKEEEYKTLIMQLEARELLYIDELEGIAIAFSTVDEALDTSLGTLPSTPLKRSGELHDASPSQTQLLSPAALHGSGSGMHSATGSSVLNQISTLRNKSSAVMTLLTTYQQKYHSFAATLEVLTNEREHQKTKMEKMEAEKLELLNAVHKSDGQVKELQEAMAKLRHYVGTCEDNHLAQKRRLLEQLLQFGSTIQGSGAQMMKLLEGETNAQVDAHTVLSEFREIHNLLTVRDDLLNTEDGSSSGELERHVSTFYTKTENLYLLCLQMVSTSIDVKRHASATVEEMQAALDQCKEAHQAALESQRQQMQHLEEDNHRLTQEMAQMARDIDDMNNELGSFRQMNSELSEQRQLLDQELQSTVQINHDLSNSLKALELANNDLTNENKRLASEIASKDTNIRQYQEQQLLLRKRVNETDLNFEKLNSMIQRLRGEKEALESVVGSLESELDRSRSDYLAIMNKYSPSNSEDRGYMFELEKLLAALHSTADQIEENFGGMVDVSASQTDMISVMTAMEVGATGSLADGLLEIQKRVEQAVTRLTRIRTRTREEGRSRKLVERQLGQLSDEIKKLLAVIEGHEANLDRCDKELADTRDVLKAREQEINELNANLLLFQSNEHEIKDKYALLEGILNDTKKENISLTEELHTKITEANRAARAMESLEATIHKLQSELQVVKLEHQQALLDSEQRDQQLKVARDNHQQVLTALEQSEENLTRERALRSQLESRLQQGEEANGHSFQQQLSLLSNDLDAKNEEIRNLLHAKVLQEERVHGLEQELQLTRQSISILEMRLENTTKEMISMTEEAAETKRKIQAAKESYEMEKSLRLRSEAAMNALKRVQDDDKRKMNMEGLVVIRNSETENLHLLAEEEKKILRSKIVELKQLCDEKEIMYHHEMNEKKRLEKELEASAHTLNKKTLELQTANHFVQLFRKEGRVVRKDVMEVMALLNEVIQAVSLDLQYGFVDFNVSASASMALLSLSEGFMWESGAGSSSGGGAGGGKLPSSLKLPEAVGMPTLFEMVRKLKEMMGRYCSEYNRFKAMIQQQSDLETERNALVKQVVSLQESSKVVTQQWSEEKKMYQAQLLKMKNNDQNTEQTHRLLQQVASLEAALKKEKERKERALQEVREVRSEVDQLTGRGVGATSIAHLAKDRNLDLDEETASLQMENQRLHNEVLTLRQDLYASMTQVQTMKELVEQLDRKVKMASDLGSKTFHSSHSFSANVTGHPASSMTRRGDEERGGEWLLTRFQIRCKAMEELASIYRQALLALSPEGPTAKLQDYHQVLSEEGISGTLLRQASGWIEKEIHTVRASYEEEIRFFETHVQDLYSKLKERQVYEVELRKQLEDVTKSFYQRSLTSNTMSEQLLSLRREVERSRADLQAIQEEWMKERKHSRLRHVKLVEDLTNALEAREVALLALRKLEQHCQHRGWDIKHYAVFEELHREVIRSSAAEDVLEGPLPYSPIPNRRSHASSPATAPSMSNIIRGIIEADHELQEAERRGRDRRREPGSASRLRSTSNTSSRSAGTGVATTLASSTMGTPVATLDTLRRQRDEQASAMYHSTLLAHHGDATVEGTLTETFLTNRAPPQAGAPPPPPAASTAAGPAASTSTTSRRTQSQIPSYSKGGGSYALPTAANSSGQSFLRVARSQTQRDV